MVGHTGIAFLACLLFTVVHAENRLLMFNETYSVWTSIEEVEKLAIQNIHFMDITDFPHLGDNPNKIFPSIPKEPRHQEEVREYLEFLSEDIISGYIQTLSDFPTRYYTTQSGLDAVIWLAGEYARYGSGRDDIEISFIEHTWLQPSLVARINGNGPLANELVIIGGHIDSVSSGERAPGADDDASGSSTVLTIFRILAEHGFKPSRTLEFHAYAAEEVGLRGSQDIAERYQREGKIIAGTLQLDMTAYVRPGTPRIINVVTDFTNPELTAFVRLLVETYTTTPWQNGACGYACSDHASWYRAGYPSSFIFEAPFSVPNPYVHTPNDLLEHLDMEHAAEYVRAGLGFAVEMAY